MISFLRVNWRLALGWPLKRVWEAEVAMAEQNRKLKATIKLNGKAAVHAESENGRLGLVGLHQELYTDKVAMQDTLKLLREVTDLLEKKYKSWFPKRRSKKVPIQ